MTIDIKLVGWEITGCRCPDHEVSLLNDREDSFLVSLIQMPNGTGKTTTLELLRLALSGSAVHKSSSEIKKYSKRDGDSSLGRIKVALSINGDRVTFIMSLDFAQGRAAYKTTKGSGQVNGFEPPLEVRKFLNSDFIDYFILDGELANRLLKHQTAAQQAIDALFQIDTLKKISQVIHDNWISKTAGQATEQAGLTRRQKEVSDLTEKISIYRADFKKVEKEIEKITHDLESKENEFDEAIKNHQSQQDNLLDLQNKLKDAQSNLRDITLQVFEASTSPQNLSPLFGQACIDLKAGLDRVKLPEAAAKEFFEEICDEPECICGTLMTKSLQETIRRKASQYLGSNDVSLLNALKTSIEERVGREPQANSNTYKELLETLSIAIRNAHDRELEFKEVTLKAGNVDPAIRNAQESINGLRERYTLKMMDIARYTTPDDSEDTRCISILEARLKIAEDKLAEITNTRSLKSKTDKLMGILDLSYKVSAKKISDEILLETNKNILEWLPHNGIEVDKIDGHLWLKNATEGSVGENLSVAYAFLSTLFNRSTHSLPFIVDSPAGPLGNKVRREIGKTIPRLTNQFVSFVISSERPDFISGGIEKVAKEIQYITIFRKRISDYFEEAKKIKGTISTSDGVIVCDKQFFYDFEMDDDS
jgi:exonuclease VII small subunit